MDDAREVKIPLILLVFGVVIYVVAGVVGAGAAGAAIVLLGIAIQIVLGVALGIAGCFLAAKLLDTSYGPIDTACLKLAAVIVFPSAIAAFIPIFGWLVALLIYWGLLAMLFDLEPFEVIATALIIWVTRTVVLLVVASLLSG